MVINIINMHVTCVLHKDALGGGMPANGLWCARYQIDGTYTLVVSYILDYIAYNAKFLKPLNCIIWAQITFFFKRKAILTLFLRWDFGLEHFSKNYMLFPYPLSWGSNFPYSFFSLFSTDADISFADITEWTLSSI